VTEPSRGPATADETGRSCPYCRFPLKEGVEAVRCGTCAAPHHADCWDENGGCAVVACAGGPRRSEPAEPGAKVSAVGKPPERPKRTRTKVVTAVVAAFLLLGAGVAVGAVALQDDSDESAVTSRPDEGAATGAIPPPPEQTIEPPPAPVEAGLTKEETVAEIAGLLERSMRGRAATLDGRYDDANAIRAEILSDLQALDTEHLPRQRRLLRQAMRASIEANDVRVACAECAFEYDETATSLKEELVASFNPLAESYLGLTFVAGEI
jgi:hypothetical protein